MNVKAPDRAGPPFLPALSGPDEDGKYRCDCEGFKKNHVERMCVRCLAIYVEGLPHLLTGRAYDREMQRAARRFKRLIEDEVPSIRKMTVNDAIRATEPPRR